MFMVNDILCFSFTTCMSCNAKVVYDASFVNFSTKKTTEKIHWRNQIQCLINPCIDNSTNCNRSTPIVYPHTSCCRNSSMQVSDEWNASWFSNLFAGTYRTVSACKPIADVRDGSWNREVDSFTESSQVHSQSQCVGKFICWTNSN